MKPFKTFFSLIALCVLGFVTAFAGVVVRTPSLHSTLEKRVEQKLSVQDTDWTHFGTHISAKGCPLYVSVRAGLEEYYGKTDFSDPGRQTGWYRAELFLKWLKRNENVLKQQNIIIELGSKKYTVPVCRALRKASYKETFSTEEIQGMLGVWLGARYAEDMFVNSRGVRFPEITLSQQTQGRAVIDGGKKTRGYIEIHPDSYALVPALNLGLHEGTHLAGWMIGRNNSLGEWGTFLATVHYALPVKAISSMHTYQGTRSFTHNASVPSVSCGEMFQEYAAFVLGARLYPEVRKQNFFAFEQQVGEYRDNTLLSLLRNLAAVQADRFYVQQAFSSVSGNESKVLSALKNRYADCPAIQEMTALEDGASFVCGKTQLEVIRSSEIGLTDKWAFVAGEKRGISALARSVAPHPMVSSAKEELKSLASYLEDDLKQIPLQEIVWQNLGIKDRDAFENSPAYTRLCNKMRRYAQDNPSGMPPVPAGYM